MLMLTHSDSDAFNALHSALALYGLPEKWRDVEWKNVINALFWSHFSQNYHLICISQLLFQADFFRLKVNELIVFIVKHSCILLFFNLK